MKIIIVAAPAVSVAIVLLALAIARRPVSRHALKVIAALVLFGYVIATSALGVFWVSRMDLPAFDWHYLSGYALMILVALHFGLELRSVTSFVRARAPKRWLTSDHRRFRPAIRAAVYALLGLIAAVPAIAWFVGAKRGAKTRVAPPGSIALAEPGQASSEIEEVWIERDGRRIGVVDYLWEQSSYSRKSVIRTPGIAPPKQRELREYSGAPALTLPPARPRSGMTLRSLAEPPHPRDGRDRIVIGRGAFGGVPSLELISDLLHHSYGVTGRHAESSGFLFRAAASSGALYPIDLFVMARGVPKLESKIHYYDPHKHALVVVPGDASTERVSEGLPADSLARDASLVLVLGATFDRTRIKYETRSYRYVGLDAGHLAENVIRAALAMRARCSLEPLFDDERLARAVGITSDGEGVVLVIACDVGAGRLSRSSRGRDTILGHSLVALPEHADEVELTRLSHRLTSFKLTDAPPLVGKPIPASQPDQGRGHELVPDAVPDVDVFELIARRRSVRDFGSAPLPLGALASVLRSAHQAGGAVGRERLVDLYVFVRSVEGLAPGVYRYRSDLGELVTLREAEVSSRVESAGLNQELLGRAGAVIAFALKSSLPGRVDGARDFRHALIEAGLGGEAVYLEAAARGLGACGVGAFFDDELAGIVETKREEPRFVHLTALGTLR